MFETDREVEEQLQPKVGGEQHPFCGRAKRNLCDVSVYQWWQWWMRHNRAFITCAISGAELTPGAFCSRATEAGAQVVLLCVWGGWVYGGGDNRISSSCSDLKHDQCSTEEGQQGQRRPSFTRASTTAPHLLLSAPTREQPSAGWVNLQHPHHTHTQQGVTLRTITDQHTHSFSPPFTGVTPSSNHFHHVSSPLMWRLTSPWSQVDALLRCEGLEHSLWCLGRNRALTGLTLGGLSN